MKVVLSCGGLGMVRQLFQRPVAERQLSPHRYDGFQTRMDTFKDQKLLDELYRRGTPPWELWRTPAVAATHAR